jgi:hypothetical protein
MSNYNSFSLTELNDRIAVIRDNIRRLVEHPRARRMKNGYLGALLSSRTNSISWSKNGTPG